MTTHPSKRAWYSPGVFCSLVLIGAALLRIAFSLRRSGFSATLEVVRRRAFRCGCGVGVDRPEVVFWVRGVARRLPVRVECMPQSLLLWNVLNRSGDSVELVMGVGAGANGEGMEAHAWIEAAGTPVAESPEKLARFSEMQRFAWGER